MTPIEEVVVALEADGIEVDEILIPEQCCLALVGGRWVHITVEDAT